MTPNGEKPQALKRIIFAIPIPYNEAQSFMRRESGVIVLALREMGYDAQLVTLHSTVGLSVIPGHPVIQCSLANLSDPDWWKSRNPDAIVLNLWSAPRYDGIRKAALKATPRVIERLDASGNRVPRIWVSYYFWQCLGHAREDGWNVVLAFMRALAKTTLYLIPSVMERPMALTMAQLPYVVAESPLAAARVERHIRWHSDAPVQVAQIPNPVYSEVMRFGPEDVKTNSIVSAARWDSQQKDFPLLFRSVVRFLEKYKDWTFECLGRGTEKHRRLISQASPEIMKRVHFHGNQPFEQIAQVNRAAKIHFLASVWEGFSNASVEALCCGCSYVGPINLAASSYLIEFNSGTIAARRREWDLFDALVAEAEAWKGSRRDPAAISAKWIKETGYHTVAQKTLQVLESIPNAA